MSNEPDSYWQVPRDTQYGQPPPPEPKHSRHPVGLYILGAAVLIGLLCLVGGTIVAVNAADDDKPTKAPAVAPDKGARPTPNLPTTKAPAAAPTTKAPAKASPTPKPKPTITDGTWSVGEDIPPGTYRAAENVAGMSCYWAKYGDSEGNRILNNDLPTGGRPQVTLKRGQWFNTERCGTWVRK